ncbi:MAG TPA: protein kinase [Gemmatimonadales bacterium]|nr:protein kinase [Gemmatimonadales bacterium]
MPADLRDQLQRSLGEAYRLERELGGGGMSRVFLATETALGRQVVVKVLLPELAAGVSVDRFRREIQLAAQLQHPHIVPLLSAGESEGLPYFTMPFVAGESLRARLVRDGELPVPEAVRVLRDVASALDYAHQSGVVHRDIKPDNVLLMHGVGVVTDFGVAKALTASAGGGERTPGLTSMGVTLGTPTYMAPEQASADPGMDHRVDVYAFGVMAYEMLAGRAPFSGRSPQAILGAHLAALPEPITNFRPALPPGLSAMIMRCLEKHPADRPQTAGDLVQSLDLLSTPSSGTVPLLPITPPVRRTTAVPAAEPRRAVAGLVVGAGIAAVILALAGLWLWTSRPRPGTGSPAANNAPVATASGAVDETLAAGTGAPASSAGGTTPRPPVDGHPDRPGAAGPPRENAGAKGREAGPGQGARNQVAESAGRSAGRATSAPRPSARPEPAPVPAGDLALLARLRQEAGSTRRQAVAAGAAAEALADGDGALARADSLERARQTAGAAAELSAAITRWRTAAAEAAPPAGAPPAAAERAAAPVPAPPASPGGLPAGGKGNPAGNPATGAAPGAVPGAVPAAPAPPAAPADPAPRIRALVDGYVAAVESRSVPAIRQAYPGLTQDQALEWERFFGAVRDVDVELQVTRLDVRGDQAEAELEGAYAFTDPGTRRPRRDQVHLHASLRRDARGWRIETLR